MNFAMYRHYIMKLYDANFLLQLGRDSDDDDYDFLATTMVTEGISTDSDEEYRVDESKPSLSSATFSLSVNQAKVQACPRKNSKVHLAVEDVDRPEAQRDGGSNEVSPGADQ